MSSTCKESPFATFDCVLPFTITGSSNTYGYTANNRYMVVTFYEAGNFTITDPSITSINCVLVGGGGNGGSNYSFTNSNGVQVVNGGGGGGGGQVINEFINVVTNQQMSISIGNNTNNTNISYGSLNLRANAGPNGSNATSTGPGSGSGGGGNGGSTTNSQGTTSGNNGVPIEIDQTIYFFGGCGGGGTYSVSSSNSLLGAGGLGGGGGSGNGYYSNQGNNYNYTTDVTVNPPSINGYNGTGGGGSGADCVNGAPPGIGGSGIAIFYFQYGPSPTGPTGFTGPTGPTGPTGITGPSFEIPFNINRTSMSYQYENNYFIITCYIAPSHNLKCTGGTSGTITFNQPIPNASIICVGGGGGGSSGWGTTNSYQIGSGGGGGGFAQVTNYNFEIGTYNTFVGAGGSGGASVTPGMNILDGNSGSSTIMYDLNNEVILYSVGGQGGSIIGGVGNTYAPYVEPVQGGNGGNGGNTQTSGNASIGALTIPTELSTYVKPIYSGGGAGGVSGNNGLGGGAGTNGVGGLISTSLTQIGENAVTPGSGGGGAGTGTLTSDQTAAGGDGGNGTIIIYFPYSYAPTGSTGPTGPTGNYLSTFKTNFVLQGFPTASLYSITVDTGLSWIVTDPATITINQKGYTGGFNSTCYNYNSRNGEMTLTTATGFTGNILDISNTNLNYLIDYSSGGPTGPTGPFGPTGSGPPTGPTGGRTGPCFIQLCKTVLKNKTISCSSSSTLDGYSIPGYKLCYPGCTQWSTVCKDWTSPCSQWSKGICKDWASPCKSWEKCSSKEFWKGDCPGCSWKDFVDGKCKACSEWGKVCKDWSYPCEQWSKVCKDWESPCANWSDCASSSWIPSIPLWPTIVFSISADVYLTFEIDIAQSDTFTVTTSTPPKPQEALKITVNNVTVNLDFEIDGTTYNIPILIYNGDNGGLNIQQSNNCPGFFNVTIPFDCYNYTYNSGLYSYGFSMTNNLSFTLDPKNNSGWVYYFGSLSLQADGYTTSTNYSCPIISVTDNN